MDVIHQELWISGHQVLNEIADLEPQQDGLVKLDPDCVWPEELPAEVIDSCGIDKNGIPVWLCDDTEVEGNKLGATDSIENSWFAQTVTISRCTSPVQQDIESPLLQPEAPMWISEVLIKSEPEEFVEPSASSSQEVDDRLSPLWPELDFKLETAEIIAEVPGQIQIQESSPCSSAMVLSQDEKKKASSCSTNKPKTQTKYGHEIIPCCVLLDRNEIPRYLKNQSQQKTNTRGRSKHSDGLISILKTSVVSHNKRAAEQSECKNKKLKVDPIKLTTEHANIDTKIVNQSDSPERLVIKIIKKDGTLQCLSPEENITSPKKIAEINKTSEFHNKLKSLIGQEKETINKIKKLECKLKYNNNNKIHKTGVPFISNDYTDLIKIEVTKVSRYMCPICKRHVAKSDSIRKHLVTKHGIRGMKIKPSLIDFHSCNRCSVASFDVDQVKNHFCTYLQNHQKQLEEQQKSIIISNENSKQIVNKFSCFYCKSKFEKENKLKNHVFWSHAMTTVGKNTTIKDEIIYYFCSICDSKFYSEIELSHHFDTHTKIVSVLKSEYEINIKKENNVEIKLENKLNDDIDFKFVDKKLNECKSNTIQDKKSSFLSEFEKFVQKGYHINDDEGEIIDVESVINEECIEVSTEVKTSNNDIIDTKQCTSNVTNLILYNEHYKMFNDLNSKKSNLVAEINNIKVNPEHEQFVKQADVLRINRRVLVSEANFSQKIPTHFKCTLCNYSTINNIHLQEHIKIHLAQDIINNSCTCGKVCSNLESLKSHINSVHKNDKEFKSLLNDLKNKQIAFRCKICSSIYTDPRLFYIHIYTQEFENQYFHECIKCNLEFNNENQLKEHSIIIHKDNLPYKCRICIKGFKNVHKLITHMKMSHTNKCIHCTVCNKSIQKDRFEEHFKICTRNINKYTCPLCPGYIHLDPESVLKHMSTKHGGYYTVANYYCKICMNYFNTLHNYQFHLKYHKDLIQFRCDFCFTLCKSKKYLQKHITIHIPKENFTCPVCNLNVSKKCTLKRHMYKCHLDLISKFVFNSDVTC